MIRSFAFSWITVSLSSLCLGEVATTSDYDPAWAATKPLRVKVHSNTNGMALMKAVAALQPGDRLEIAPGTYSVDRMWDITVRGTRQAPIWIVAKEATTVILTRPDDAQNVLNVGQSKPVGFLCLQGLELTGGSHGLRLGQCQDVWVDRCHIHHTANVCLSANSADTTRLHLTRNHLHHGGGHGEGMYLGANEGQFMMSQSVIALNHVHDCAGDQGDGIEVKQGSWGNRIVQNHVHDTNYPCITVYGTNGKAVNLIERNLCYRSNDHVMQVQGEAIVQNNVLIDSKGSCFASTDHQGRTRNLQIIHNTMINTTHAFAGSSWNNREGLVVANNILYSREGNAFHFPNGSAGVVIQGNVVLGDGARFDSARGRGLEDFRHVAWDAANRDVTPIESAPFQAAVPEFRINTDFTGKVRLKNYSGAIEPK